MTNKTITQQYIQHLQQGDMQKVIALFTEDAKVQSPIYGTQNAREFYTNLASDTTQSELKIKGTFEETDSNRIALYFNYQWTLKNGKDINFDVVDIIDFDEDNKITNLQIIYDASISRKLVEEQ